MKWTTSAAVILAAVGLIAGLWLHARGGETGAITVRRVARGVDQSDEWPSSRSWVWQVGPITGKSQIGVCVRTVESSLPAKTPLAIRFAAELPERGEERHVGWFQVGDSGLSARVTCQVIDLQEIGLGDAAGKQPLRLLVKLRAGGGMTKIDGQQSILPGDTYAGLSEGNEKWAGNELLLLTVYSRAADTVYAHHVILQRRDAE